MQLLFFPFEEIKFLNKIVKIFYILYVAVAEAARKGAAPQQITINIRSYEEKRDGKGKHILSPQYLSV